MRCSNRSIVSFSNAPARRVWLVAMATIVTMMVAVPPAGVAITAAAADGDTVRQVELAIAAAVRSRMGDMAEVSVTIGQVRLLDGEFNDLEARPAPGARLGRPTRFTLYQKPTDLSGVAARIGYAVAETHVEVGHVHAVRPIGRGTVLAADDLVAIEGDVGAILMRPLPTHPDLVGAMASRDLRSGDLITSTVIRLPKLGRARESVVVTVHVGSVTVSGHATAKESGELGDVIALVNELSGRRLTGRVVALGEVEVVQ